MKNEALGIFLFSFVLDLMFVYFVNPVLVTSDYGLYRGFEFDLTNYVLVKIILFLLFIPIYFTKFKKGLFYRFFSIMLIINLLPTTTFAGFGIHEFSFQTLNLLFWVIFIALAIALNNIELQRISGLISLDYLVVGVILVSTIWLGLLSDFRIDLNIFNAYDYREEAGNYDYPALLTYLLGLSRFLLPVMLVFYLQKKQYLLAGLILYASVISYTFNGSKALFFLIVVALVLHYMPKRTSNYVLVGLGVLSIISLIDYLYFSNLTSILVIRRLFFVPQIINEYVYEIYMDIGANYYSQLSRFFSSAYEIFNINSYIGLNYFGSANMSANSGMIADSLWQLGYLGLIIHPLIIVGIVKVLDANIDSKSDRLILIPALVIAYYFNNSGLITALLSHGILTFLLVLILSKRQI